MSCAESVSAKGEEKNNKNNALSSMSLKMLNALSSYKNMVVGSNASFISSLSKRFSSIRQSIRGARNNRTKGSAWEHALAQAELRQKVYNDLDVMDSVDHATLLRGKFFPLVDAYTLKRFLVARKYDVENASQMLMNYIGWRVSNFPENQIKSEEIQTSLAADKVQVLKYPDKQGHICIVIVVRKHNMKEVDIEETEKMIIYVLDKVISMFLTGRKSMKKLTCIIDLQKIGWNSLDGEALKTILQLLQNYFPERLALMVLWCPPRIFWIVYKMVIPFVDAKTRGKITMAYKGEELAQYFDHSKIPASLGGTGHEEELFIPILRLEKEDIVLSGSSSKGQPPLGEASRIIREE
jgi:hypothetical protein